MLHRISIHLSSSLDTVEASSIMAQFHPTITPEALKDKVIVVTGQLCAYSPQRLWLT